SSSPTALTSTTSSSPALPSPADPGRLRTPSVSSHPAGGVRGGAKGCEEAVAVVACGAIARHVADVAARRGWPVDVHPLPPLLHNRPERIAAEVEQAVARLRAEY